MTWRRRILLYLFGFGLGCIIFWFLFGDRLTGWLPESRVLSLLKNAKVFQVDSSAACELRCNKQTLADLRAAIPQADVDLGKSQAQKEPCKEYYLKMKVGTQNLDAYFSACPRDSTVRLLHVYGAEKCLCK